MMHFTPVSDFPLFSTNFLTFWKISPNFTFSRTNFPFSSAKISDDLFFSHRPQISDSPYFPCFSTFPPLIRENLLFPPYLSKFPLCFPRIQQLFTYFTCISPSALTMMHLCITQGTYWKPLTTTAYN